MPLVIDRSLYVASPRIGVDSGATLLEQLVDVAKDDESEVIGGSVKKLRKVLGKARDTKARGVRVGATATAAGDLGLDRRADRCMRALRDRLEAWTVVAELEPERAERAQGHLRLLFPSGLQPTQASFAVQDAEMRRMVGELKDAALEESVTELAGEEFVAAFRSVAKEYSAMVKAMGRTVAEEVDQRSMVGEMQLAIVQHTSRVLGELDDDDPESVQRVRKLLAPIDNFRARAAQGGAGGSTTEADADVPADAPASA